MLKIIFILLSIIFSQSAFAQSGIYIASEGGLSSSNPAWRLGVGYLHDLGWLNDKFGLGFEANLGWYHGASTSEFLAVFPWHLDPIDLFIKFGGIRHTFNNINQTKIQPEITAGINYNFNKHFALTSEYLHSFGSENQYPSLNAILAGVRIAFW